MSQGDKAAQWAFWTFHQYVNTFTGSLHLVGVMSGPVVANRLSASTLPQVGAHREHGIFLQSRKSLSKSESPRIIPSTRNNYFNNNSNIEPTTAIDICTRVQ